MIDCFTTAEPSTRTPRSKDDETDIIRVVHREGNSFAFEVIHVQRSRLAAILGRIHQLELPRAGRDKVRRTILVAERMTADDDGLMPPRNGPRDALEDNRLAEDCATEDVADLCTNATSDAAKGKCGRSGAIHTVPLGERHICLRLNSFTRASSGVMVAHLIPTLCLRIASADSIVTLSSVYTNAEYGGSQRGETGGKVRSMQVAGTNDVLHRGTRDRGQST